MPRSSIFHLHIPTLVTHRGLPSDDAKKLSETTNTAALEGKIGTETPPEDIHRITSRTGTIAFLYPTHAHILVDSKTKLDWYSRDHRKGRHPLKEGERRTINTFLRLEYWNISWWVAMV